MIRFYIILMVLLGAMSSGMAAPPRGLSPEEAKELSTQAKKFQRAWEVGDAETCIEKTHPAIYRSGLTREAWARELRETLPKTASVTKMEQFQWKGISLLYESDTEEVCFITRTYIFRVMNKRFHGVDFLIAARDVGTTEWRFILGDNVAKNPDQFWVLFRHLPKNITPPECKVTPLQ